MGKSKQVVDWQAMAKELAEVAHEDHFSLRRGLWPTFGNEGRKLIIGYFNNDPYIHRDQELAAFRAWLGSQTDVSELASASYPNDGYTLALILKAPPESLTEIERQLRLSIERRGLHVVRPVEASG